MGRKPIRDNNLRRIDIQEIITERMFYYQVGVFIPVRQYGCRKQIHALAVEGQPERQAQRREEL